MDEQPILLTLLGYIVQILSPILAVVITLWYAFPRYRQERVFDHRLAWYREMLQVLTRLQHQAFLLRQQLDDPQTWSFMSSVTQQSARKIQRMNEDIQQIAVAYRTHLTVSGLYLDAAGQQCLQRCQERFEQMMDTYKEHESTLKPDPSIVWKWKQKQIQKTLITLIEMVDQAISETITEITHAGRHFLDVQDQRQDDRNPAQFRNTPVCW